MRTPGRRRAASGQLPRLNWLQVSRLRSDRSVLGFRYCSVLDDAFGPKKYGRLRSGLKISITIGRTGAGGAG